MLSLEGSQVSIFSFFNNEHSLVTKSNSKSDQAWNLFINLFSYWRLSFNGGGWGAGDVAGEGFAGSVI